MDFIKRIADDIEAGKNPLVKFANTYDLHDEMKRRGWFDVHPLPVRCRRSNGVRYRVDHRFEGVGEITQNSWDWRDTSPRMTVIKEIGEALMLAI